jgi:trehalose/maltose hydrolase-like predicted phosphorylase
VCIVGVETTNDEICASQEIHINGDISFALQQFWWATGDVELMFSNNSLFADVAFGIADFWISRVFFNVTRQLFEIHR